MDYIQFAFRTTTVVKLNETKETSKTWNVKKYNFKNVYFLSASLALVFFVYFYWINNAI